MKNKNLKIIISIFFSTLSAVIAAIVWILASLFINTYLGWFGYLIAFGSYFGFVKIYGSNTKKAIYYAIALIIILIPLTVLISLIVNILRFNTLDSISDLGMYIREIPIIYWLRVYMPDVILGYVVAGLYLVTKYNNFTKKS